jgi:hypothetical protein
VTNDGKHVIDNAAVGQCHGIMLCLSRLGLIRISV